VADLSLAVVLHDVAPATWPDYADFVARLDALGPVPLTLLVVPDFHRHGSLLHDPGFCETMARRLARGDELALHGYYHDDPGPVPPWPGHWLRRRFLTHEGEFYALDAAMARQRLEAGVALFQQLQWPLGGFVPPGWQLGKATRRMLADFPFRYTSDPRALIRLPDFTNLPAPSLVWSARSTWRRGLSRPWNTYLLGRHSETDRLRLGLHPVDMRHPTVRDWWLETLRTLLKTRRASTKSAWLETA